MLSGATLAITEKNLFNQLESRDVVEKIVRLSLAVRRQNPQGHIPTQEELVEMWGIKEETLAVAPPIVRINRGTDSQDESKAD